MTNAKPFKRYAMRVDGKLTCFGSSWEAGYALGQIAANLGVDGRGLCPLGNPWQDKAIVVLGFPRPINIYLKRNANDVAGQNLDESDKQEFREGMWDGFTEEEGGLDKIK